jgi:hypothetical protein
MDVVVRMVEASEPVTIALNLDKDLLGLCGYVGTATIPANRHPKKADINSRPGGIEE